VLTRTGFYRQTFLAHSELSDFMIDGAFSYLMMLFVCIDYVALNSICLGMVKFQNYVERSSLGYIGPPLWSSGQSSWLQIQRSRFDSRRYHSF
jgi:hypothetical protein